MNASLREKLDNVEWGEFKLENLFTNSNGDYDIQKKHINGRGTWVITSGLVDNGILGRTDIEAKIFPSGTLTVDMFGHVFYRNFPYKMVTHARVFSLVPKFNISDNQGLFLSNSFRYIHYYFGYDNMCIWDKIKNFYIKLPIKSNGKIDFDFMEHFIAELKEERLAELKEERLAELRAYLQVCGLDNYELTDEEKEVIQAYKNNQICLSDFTFSKIFNKIEQGKRLKKSDQQKGNIPFVMSGVTNNGIVGYISNPVACFPKNSITIDIFGNSFYRNYAFGAGDDTGVYWNDKINYSAKTMLYFTAAMEKSLNGRFSYGKKLRSSQSFNFKIQLPVKNGKIDYETMDRFISAVQKLVIKDVVLYADREIEATEKIVNNN